MILHKDNRLKILKIGLHKLINMVIKMLLNCLSEIKAIYKRADKSNFNKVLVFFYIGKTLADSLGIKFL